MEGWTGKVCPNCDGRCTVRDDDGNEVTCDACGGTGDEWGEIPDEPVVREPGGCGTPDLRHMQERDGSKRTAFM